MSPNMTSLAMHPDPETQAEQRPFEQLFQASPGSCDCILGSNLDLLEPFLKPFVAFFEPFRARETSNLARQAFETLALGRAHVLPSA